MRSAKSFLIGESVVAALAFILAGAADIQAQSPAASGYTGTLDAGTLKEINALYRKLIEAENRHDLAEVRTMVWDSPSTLFVAKTATAAEGNWAGFWAPMSSCSTSPTSTMRARSGSIRTTTRKRSWA